MILQCPGQPPRGPNFVKGVGPLHSHYNKPDIKLTLIVSELDNKGWKV